MARFKAIKSEICWYSYDTNLLSAKKSLNMFEVRLYENTSRKCFVPAVNLVIFMAQRLNMAVLSESELRASLREFYEIQLSVLMAAGK